MNISDYILKEILYADKKIEVVRALRGDSQQTPFILKVLQKDATSSLQHEYELFRHLKKKEVQGIVSPNSLILQHDSSLLELENIPGKLLEDFIKDHPLDLKTFFRIALQLVEIIANLHHANIIHKDIKPSNFIIDPETLQVTLLDLRISTQLSTMNQEYINPHLLQGTLAYISPEQTGRINRPIDYRTDFYSLGIMFYQMLTGELPFQTEGALELVYSHIAKIPPMVTEKNPQVPTVLAEMVEKLLAKMPEDRYKSAFGLKNDLKKCEAYWASTGNIPHFKLGETDLPSHLNISHRLYGRSASVKLLLESFDKVSQGQKKLMLVTGYSGIGKTSLVSEVHKPISRQKGYYVAGKYDQVQRSTPYSGFLNALQGLIEHTLADTEENLTQLKTELLQNIGNLGPLIAEVFPSIELIIGKQALVPEEDYKEIRNLFNIAMKKLIQTFATEAHPLVMFVDDLQWADVASLKLIEYLLKEKDIRYFLIIGAYRDNEVDIGHPLLMTIQELQKTPYLVEALSLDPLQLGDVELLLTDTFGQTSSPLKALTEQIMQKTNGNPFFINQFLKNLYRNSLIYFSHQKGQWEWDIEKINQQDITDNVVDLLRNSLKKLSPSVQETLKVAACIGHTFDLALLANMGNRKISSVAADLWEAMRLELIVPLNETYKLIGSIGNENEELENSLASKIKYRFIHDRVQQAAYFLISEQEKRQLHLKIGHTLLAVKKTQGKEAVDDALFDIVNHINLGKEYISQMERKLEIAKLNCKAGYKAIESSAFDQAQKYFEEGLALLGENCWEKHHSLTFELYFATIKSYYLNKEFDEVLKLVQQTLPKTIQPLEKGLLYNQVVQLYADQGKLLESLQAGIKTLSLFGVEFPTLDPVVVPKKPSIKLFMRKGLDDFFRRIYMHIIDKYIPMLDNLPKFIGSFILKFSFLLLKVLCLINKITYQTVEKEVEKIHTQLNRYTTKQLLDLPLMTDPVKIETVKLLGQMVATSYMAAPRLLPIFTCLIIKLTLQYGNSPDSAFGYACYAIVLTIFKHGIDESCKMAELAEALMYRISNRILPDVVHATAITFVWKRNLPEVRAVLADSYSIAMERGLWDTACRSMYAYMTLGFFMGINLQQQETEMNKGKKIILKNKQQAMYYWGEAFYQFVCNLLGSTSNPLELELTDYDNPSRKILLTPGSTVNKSVICKGYILKSLLAYIFLDFNKALENADIAIDFLDASPAMPLITTLNLAHTLTLTALYPTVDDSTQQQFMKKILENKSEIEEWATNAPTTYTANLLLINAEYCKVLKKFDEAAKYYEQAIEAAEKNNLLHIACLVYECMARFHLASQNLSQARVYMNKAYVAYKAWGAVAKCKALERDYAEWLDKPKEDSNILLLKENLSSGSLSVSSNSLLDVIAILEANQTIASETELDQVVGKLLYIVLENTGAQHALLLREHEEKWSVEGAASYLHQQFILNESVNQGDTEEVMPSKLINYVTRTRKPLIIEDVSKHEQASMDNYIHHAQPKSLLMLPIFYRNKLRRILYLENTLLTSAFTPRHLQVLEILIGQASITLENAYLIVEYKRAKEQAESGNRVKSEFLANISHELRTPLNAVIGYTEIVQDELQTLNGLDSQAASLQKVLDSSRHLLDLIDQLLDITKIEMGKLDVLAEEIDVKEFMEKIEVIVSPLMKENNNILQFKLGPEVKKITADPLKLRQVLLNLISNAVKFTKEGKISVETKLLSPKDNSSSGKVQFSVSDTGIGMDEAEFDKLFKLFSQVDASSTRKYGGTGLGLYLTRRLVEMQGGEITVQSKKGEGSCFAVILPIDVEGKE